MKKNLPNLMGSIVFCCAISSASFSQKEHTLVSNQLLKIAYSDGACEIEPGKIPYQYAFLKIENLTNSELTIGCNIVVQYEEGCSGCNGSDESRYYLKLKPKESYTASCESDDKSLIFIRNPNFSGAWNFKEIRIENLDIK